MRDLSRLRVGIEAELDQLLAWVRDSSEKTEIVIALLQERHTLLGQVFNELKGGGPLWDRRMAELVELKERIISYSREDKNYGGED
jgi:hypothetical protein